jgi:hypothetical protein
MVYTIVRIVNNSPKAAVFTNPVRGRDRHVVPAVPTNVEQDPDANIVVPDPPVQIEVIKNPTTYPTALEKALNIYTLKNNWCFWDSGVKGANDLIGAGEGEDKSLLHLPANTTKLELVVSAHGVPSFRAPSDYQRFLINFKIQAQVRLNWCWAAAAASIANYYEKNETWTPCKVANLVLGRTDCCGVSGVQCDKSVEFFEALKTMGHLEDAPRSGLSFSDVKKEIDKGRPILAALKGLAGHGVVITGYNNFNPKTRTIEVQDPSGGSKIVCDFKKFPGSYGRGYTWVATCRTK